MFTPTARRPVQFLAITVAAVGLAVAAVYYMTPSDPPDERSRYTELACASQVFVGRTSDVRAGDVPETQTITLDVEQWIKPSTGPASVVLSNVDGPSGPGGEPAWTEPVKRLVSVTGTGPDRVRQVTDKRVSIDRAIDSTVADLPIAATTTCPVD